jgi:hypothetical protein
VKEFVRRSCVEGDYHQRNPWDLRYYLPGLCGVKPRSGGASRRIKMTRYLLDFDNVASVALASRFILLFIQVT